MKMRGRFRIAIVPVVGIVLMQTMVGAAAQSSVANRAQGSRAASVPPEARKTIEEANQSWLGAMRRQDAAAIAEPYADDAVFVTASGVTATGRTAIAQLMRDRFAQPSKVVGGRLIQDGIVRQGSSIYEWGHATLDLAAPDGTASRSVGRYLTVWQQKPGGRWEIIRNLSLPE